MTSRTKPLPLAVHDQLKKGYEYWQLVLSEFTWIADEYETKGRTDFLIDWDAVKERFYSFRQTVYSAANDGVAEEIESIVTMVDSENRGVFYLNKWADLNNRVSTYINKDHGNHTANLSKLLGSGLTDDETICIVQTAAKDAGSGLVRVGEKVVSELSRLVWYKQHTDLIRIRTVLISTDQDSEPMEPGGRYSWKGSKTDLAELVWALSKSGRVADTTTGQRATIEELTHQFETLFGLSINVKGLMQGRKAPYKAADDGLTFTSVLSELVDGYIANQ